MGKSQQTDLFSDMLSPYIDAPENIKEFFVKKSTGKIKFEEIEYDFDLKTTKVNECMHYFSKGETCKYYLI